MRRMDVAPETVDGERRPGWMAAARWACLAGATAAVGWALGALGLPSSYLFGALLVGIATTLIAPDRVAVPDAGFTAAQAVAGVALGTFLDSSSLDAIAGGWLPLTLVTAATLAISLAAGAVLARVTGLDPATAALGMVAGGASGIVGMAGELGADDRLVAFMQYLRVLVIVLLTPVLVALAFPGDAATATAASEAVLGDARGWALAVGVAVTGAVVGERARMPGGALLGPMVLAAVVTLAVPGGAFDVPPLLRETAFALIGLQVGLKFTLETIRQLGRLLVPVLLALAGVLVACGLLAVVLDVTTSVSLRDAYLATTPGGLYAVVAVALGADANAGFILAAQGVRLLVMVLLAPVVVRWMLARPNSVRQPPEFRA
jgi:membrane AbrB-like protein